MRVQLKPQKRNPDRTSVYLNGKFIFGVDRETLERLSYFTKSELSDAELRKLIYEAERTQARNYALRLLSFRMRTKKELHDRLQRREFSEPVKKDVLDELEKLGLLDDQKFVESFIRDRLNFGLKGKRMIFAELVKKGVDNNHIKAMLGEISEQDEEEACKKLIQKYSKRYQHLAAGDKKQRLFGLLNRHGFSYSVIKRALRIEETE